MNDLQQQIQANAEALIESLREQIRIRSVYEKDGSGYPFGRGVQQSLEACLALGKRLGLKTVNVDHMVGWCEYGEGEEMVAVVGHLDVVPEGEGWDHGPYLGEVADGNIYGRGAIDNKGPVVAAMYALAAIKQLGLPLKRRVRVLFGTNEETGSACMKHYLATGGEVPVMGFTPDGEYPIINGEKGLINMGFLKKFRQKGALRLCSITGGVATNVVPDSARAVFVCAKEDAARFAAFGSEQVKIIPTETGFAVEARGVSAHAQSPDEGENAIGRLLCLLHRLPLEGELAAAVGFLAEKIGTEWDGASLGIATEDAISGKLTFNLGVIRGDAEQLEVKINFRYPVTGSYAACAPAVEQAFADAGFQQTMCTHKRSVYMPPESALIQKLSRVYEAQTGDKAVLKSIGGGTYAKSLPNLVAFGPIFPGDAVREHKPNEYIEIEKLMKNTQIIAAAMVELAN